MTRTSRTLRLASMAVGALLIPAAVVAVPSTATAAQIGTLSLARTTGGDLTSQDQTFNFTTSAGCPSSPTDATNFQIRISGPGLTGSPNIQGNTGQGTVGGDINVAFSGPVQQTLAGFATNQAQAGGYLGAGVYTMQLVCRDSISSTSLGEFVTYLTVTGSGAASTVSVSDTPPPSAPINTALPALTGTAQVGSTLTCTTGTWDNSPTSYQYEFLRGASVVQTSTTDTDVVLTGADLGTEYTCRVTATNTGGSTEATSSARTITAAPKPVNTVSPTLTGTARVGSVLTCNKGTWSNSPTSYSYKFYRGTTLVQTSTTVRTRTMVPADLGKAVKCLVTATNAGGSATKYTLARTITAGPAPTATVRPKVTSTPLVGRTLTAARGTWSPTATYVYSYTWKRGTTVVGTGATYVAKALDRGKAITVTVKATRAGYLAGTSTSLPVTVR